MKHRGLGGIFVRRRGPRPLPGAPDLRSTHYWITYTVDGVRQREPARPNTERAATALLKRRLGEIASGQFTGRAAEKVSFDDLLALLRQDYEMNGRRTLDRVLRSTLHLRHAFGRMRTAQITRAAVARYVVARRESGAAANTVRNEVGTLSRMLVLAVRHGLLPHAPRFERPKPPPPRDEMLSDEELAQVLDVLKHGRPASALQRALAPQPGLAAAVEFAAWCGWRVKSDVLPLRWSDVDWQAGVVMRASRGTSKAHTRLNWALAAAPEVRTLFEQQREHRVAIGRERGITPTLVFTRPDGSRIDYQQALAAFTAACEACGLQHRVLHDLRRTAARRLRTLGLSDRDIAEVVGWRTVTMVSRYLGTDPAGVTARLAAAVAQSLGTIRAPEASERERERRGA